MSLNGAVIATSVDTEKVLDASILSRFWKNPNKIHNENSLVMEAANRERLRKSNYGILQNSKEARVKRRHKKCIVEDTLAEERKIQAMELVCTLIT
ncbi:hypothetical protein TNCV_3725021 [Trichonephila clavipes]|nr:hypothetical protein TNCV_3725021 [Trichonephila clavipes]